MIFTSGNFHFFLVISPSSVQNVQISAWKLETQEATFFGEVCTARVGQSSMIVVKPEYFSNFFADIFLLLLLPHLQCRI